MVEPSSGAAPSTPVVPPKSEGVPFYNVQSWIAQNPGAALVPTIQHVIDQANSTGVTGSIVYFPAGTYALDDGLTVPEGVTLLGAGWNRPATLKATQLGTWIQVKAGASFSPLTIKEPGAAIRNMAFVVVDQLSDAAPASAAPMISITADQALVEDVFLYNPYSGISINNCGQVVIRRVAGQPLACGIAIDASEDTNYIDSVHFWVYWVQIDPPASPSVAAEYQRANGVAIQLFRSDNAHISNVLAYNYNVGLALSRSPSPRKGDESPIPHKVHLVNADFDSCVTGIKVSASPELSDQGTLVSSCSIQLSNVTIQASQDKGAPSGNGILVDDTSDYAIVQASNLRVARSGLDAIRIDAAYVRFYGENVLIEDWGKGEGFCISSSKSFAYLGCGCDYTPRTSLPYFPATQFLTPTLAQPKA